MEKKQKKESAKRLLAYSAAAGLGAFAFGQASQAAVVHYELADRTLDDVTYPWTGTSTNTGEFTVDIDMDGDADFKFLLADFGLYNYSRVRALPVDYNLSLTNLAKGSSYYIRSFDAGDLIGFSNLNVANCTGPKVMKPATNAGGFEQPDLYFGIALHEQGSTDFNMGWIRVQTTFTPPTVPATPGASKFGTANAVTVFEFAYETEPNVGIIAGAVPEPGCLGLLAAGMGALSLRRRTA